MEITFLDLETTDKNPSGAEILTACFRTRRLHDFSFVDETYLTFRPEKYIDSSFRIHSISRAQSLSFDDKWDSFRHLLGYIVKHKDGFFCCHANHLVFGASGYFDIQVIEKMAFDQSSETYYWWLKMKSKLKIISTHTIAKKKIYCEKYDLRTVAEHCGHSFKHHDVREDVGACEAIFKTLVPLNISESELMELGNYKYGGV